MEDYPVYKFTVKENGTDTGMVGISLVTDPAIMSNWQTFSEVEKPKYIALKNEDGEYKQELLGAALRPDIPILRVDDYGNYYYGIFEKETIETIRNKFHKQKYTSEVNLQHDPNMKVDAYLIESYIIETEEQLKAVKDLGLEDVETGAWIVRYKVESEDVFNQALEGNLNGFSVEILLNRELAEMQKNNNINLNKKIMSDFKKLIDKFKSVLNEFEEAEAVETPPTNEEDKGEQKFEDALVADTDMVLRFTNVGEPVQQVITDEEGNESLEPVEQGEYILEDGRTVVVDENGNLSEIMDAEEPVEPVDADEVEASKEGLAEEDGASEPVSDLGKTISELIPTDVDGTYELEVYVSNGQITFGTLYAWTYKDLQLSKVVEDFEALKDENKKLKEDLNKPIGAPVFSTLKEEKEKKRKEDFKDNVEYTLHRLGLD